MPPTRISARPGQLSFKENPAPGLAGSKVGSVAALDGRRTLLSLPRQMGWAEKRAEQNDCHSRLNPARVCAKDELRHVNSGIRSVVPCRCFEGTAMRQASARSGTQFRTRDYLREPNSSVLASWR